MSAPQDRLPSAVGVARIMDCKTAKTAATNANGVMDIAVGRMREASISTISAVWGSQTGSEVLFMGI